MYQVGISQKARKQLSKMDKYTAKMLVEWITGLDGTDNPRQTGKALTGKYLVKWRYRVGDYRIIAEIQDQRLIILVISIGHRREIYE